MKKAPMTAAEARKNIIAMKAETPVSAMRRLLKLALGPVGNLSPEARSIYEAALRQIG